MPGLPKSGFNAIAALLSVLVAGGCGSLAGEDTTCSAEDLRLAERLYGFDVLSAHPAQATLVSNTYSCDPSDGYSSAVAEYRSSLSRATLTAFYAKFLQSDGWDFRPEVPLPSPVPQRSADGVGSMVKVFDGVPVQFSLSFGDPEQPGQVSDRYAVQVSG
jgi:hypothetical protein